MQTVQYSPTLIDLLEPRQSKSYITIDCFLKTIKVTNPGINNEVHYRTVNLMNRLLKLCWFIITIIIVISQ